MHMANSTSQGSGRNTSKGKQQFGMRKKKAGPGSVVQEGPGDSRRK
jgi:hypothetical protein